MSIQIRSHMRNATLALGILGLLAACSQPAGGGSAAGFSLTLEPASVTVAAGGSTAVRLDVGSEGGFSGEVSLALEGPDGVTVSPTRVPVPGGPYTLTFAVGDSVAPGRYPLVLVGTSGSLSARADLTLTVAAPAPDFQAVLEPTVLEAEPGGSAGATLTLTPENGFSGSVALSLVDASDDPVPGFALTPASVSVGERVEQALGIQVADIVPLGSYPLRLKLFGGGVTHYLGLDLTVKGFALSLASDRLYVAQGESALLSLRVDAVGVSGDMSLSLEDQNGSPPPDGLALAPASVAVPGGPYALTLTADPGLAVGRYDLRLRAALGGTVRTVDFTLTVQPPPEFTARVSPDALTVEVGASDTLYLELAFQTDFSGDINFALESADGSAAPAGLSLSPATIGMAASPGDTDYVSLDLAVADTAEPGTYALRVRTASASTTQYAGFTLTVPVPPDFTLGLDPTIANVVAGGTATVQLDVVPHNGFAGVVQLSLVDSSNGAAPTGIALEPTSVDLSGGAVSQPLTLRVDEGVAVDRYYLQVVGSGGGTTQAANLSLAVQDFGLSFGGSSPSLAADQGSSAAVTLTVQVSQPDSYSTFPGPVALELATRDGAPLPAGLSLAPTSVDVSSGYVNVNLTVTADASTPPGSYALRVIGRAGGAARTAAFDLDVRGFDLALAASELAFWTEGSGDLGLTLTPGGGFNDTVSLSLEAPDGSAAPAGLTLTPSSVTFSSTASVTLTVAADASVAAGVYPLRLKAASGSIVHYADFTLKVGDFDLALDTSSLSLWQNDRGGLGVTITPEGGFAGAVDLYLVPQAGASGPAGVSLDPSALDVNGAVTQTVGVVAADSASPGSFAMQLEARAYLGGEERTRAVPLTLDVNGFLLSLDRASYAVARGGSAVGQLSLESYGINDDVTLSLTGAGGAALPADVTFTPAAVGANDGGVTAGITIGTGAATAYGNPAVYPLTLTASWGALAHTVDLDLLVYRETVFWMPRDAGTSYDLSDVAYGDVGGQGLFVAVGGGQTSTTTSGFGVASVSGDGHAWTTGDADTANELHAVAYGNGVFVATGEACEVTTYDGSGWTQRAVPDALCSSQFNGAAYGGGAFVLVGDGGAIFRSTDDGASWSQVTDLPYGTGDLYDVAYAGTRFVAVGAGGTILTSSDGLSWSAQASGTTADLTAVAYGDGTYVVAGTGGAVLTSSDGSTWAAGSLGTSLDATGATYGYDRDGAGIFVVTVRSSNYGVYTSDDGGQSWSAQNSGATDGDPLAAAYGDYTFVIVGYDGTVASSP